MGKPGPQGSLLTEYIGQVERTRRTETSKYPEERTSTETPLVVASERGPGQCLFKVNRNDLEKSAIVGDSPVRKNSGVELGLEQVGRSTRNSV